MAAAYAGDDEQGVRVYQEAFDVYWRREFLPVLEWRVRPPLLDGFAEFVRASRPRRRIAELLGPGHPPADPDSGPLGKAAALEVDAIESALVPEARGTLRPIAWRHVPTEVVIPGWRHRAEAHERAVVGMTVADAGPAATDPAAVARRLAPPEVQAQIEDQLWKTGVETLTHAVAVALVDAGGTLLFRLGEPYAIEVGGTRFEPWTELEAIAGGQAAPPGWVAKCAEAGVAHQPLV